MCAAVARAQLPTLGLMQTLDLERHQLLRTQHPCATTWWHRRRRPRSCLVRRHLATSSSGRLPTSIPRAFRPSKQIQELRLARQPNRLVQQQLQRPNGLALRKYCNLPNALRRQAQQAFQSTQRSELSCATNLKFGHPSAALFCQIPCAMRGGLAFHVRLDEFPCDQMVRGKDRRRANHDVVQMKT